MNSLTFKYRFKSSNKVRTHDCGLWNDIRYKLELKHGCIFISAKTPRQISYLIGYHDNEIFDQKILSNYMIQKDDSIVLCIKQMPIYLQAYIPRNILSDGVIVYSNNPDKFEIEISSEDSDVDNDDKPQKKRICTGYNNSIVYDDTCAVFSKECRRKLSYDYIQHPSEYTIRNKEYIPSTSYLCPGCDKRGVHFKHNCPNITITKQERGMGGTEYLVKTKTIYGVPLSQLRPATEDEISRGKYRLLANGKKVVRKVKDKVKDK